MPALVPALMPALVPVLVPPLMQRPGLWKTLYRIDSSIKPLDSTRPIADVNPLAG